MATTNEVLHLSHDHPLIDDFGSSSIAEPGFFHFRHQHPLILIDDFDSSRVAARLVCCICETSIIGLSPAYTCSLQHSPCSFFLHKRCAESSPPRIIHHMHPQHQLELCNYPYYLRIIEESPSLEDVDIACAACTREIHQVMWTYNCTLCMLDSVEKESAKIVDPFALCPRCAVMESVLDHEGHHHHSLTLLRRTACFSCDACGIKAEEFGSYICHSCHFWIHSSCAAYPRTIKLRIHEDDTLKLIYSIPEMYRRFIRHCPICRQGVEQKNWAYFCEESGYFVHIKCAAALLASGKNMIDTEDDDEQTYSDLLQFPLPRTESLVENGIENEVNKGEESPLINHWSHPEHKLFLLEELQNAHHNSDDDDDDERDTNKRIDEMLVCDGCVQPISTASDKRYYGCIGCNYFLHTTCANHLPLQSRPGKCPRDPQHILQLDHHSTSPLTETTICYGCYERTNGFTYRCSTCLSPFCISCSLTPQKIKHEYHKHPLVLRHATSQKTCNACLEIIISEFEYGCESCGHIQIHLSCAVSFPKTIYHRWDSHSISLIYPPIYYKGLRYCEKCELEVNPEAWLYRCSECDQCFHPLCIRQPHLKLGHTIHPSITHTLHPHPLTLKMIYKNRYPQRLHQSLACRQIFCVGTYWLQRFKCQLVLECAGCNYIICTTCSSKQISILENSSGVLEP